MEDEDFQLQLSRENLKNEIKVPFASISSFLWFIFILVTLIAVFFIYDYTKMMHRIWMQLLLTFYNKCIHFSAIKFYIDK